MTSSSIASACRTVLESADPHIKIMQARKVARDWRLGRLAHDFDCVLPDRRSKNHCWANKCVATPTGQYAAGPDVGGTKRCSVIAVGIEHGAAVGDAFERVVHRGFLLIGRAHLLSGRAVSSGVDS